MDPQLSMFRQSRVHKIYCFPRSQSISVKCFFLIMHLDIAIKLTAHDLPSKCIYFITTFVTVKIFSIPVMHFLYLTFHLFDLILN